MEVLVVSAPKDKAAVLEHVLAFPTAPEELVAMTVVDITLVDVVHLQLLV